MKVLILSLTGGVILSLVADVLLPDGELRKYARFAIGVVLSIIIANPIINFITSMKSGDFSFSKFTVSETFVERMENEKVDIYEKAVVYALKEAGIEAEATVYLENEEVFEVVIRVSSGENRERARSIVEKAFSLSKERVKVYG